MSQVCVCGKDTHWTTDTKEETERGRQQRKSSLMNGGVSEGLRLDGGGEEEVEGKTDR